MIKWQVSVTRVKRRNRAETGFTLLELLVVMTLLSLLMAGLVSALRTMAQTESKIEQKLQRQDEIRVVRSFLAQTLGRISSKTLDAPGASGKKIVPFFALTSGITWVGVMPARPNVGGRYFFRLATQDDADRTTLVLKYLPWDADTAVPDWTSAETSVLLKGIKHLTVQAQGAPPADYPQVKSWPRGWQDGWPVEDALPEQVRLMVADSQGDWPEWVIPVRALNQSDANVSLQVIGGTKR